LARRLSAGRTVVLTYHNIVPDGVPVIGEQSLHLPRAQFAAQLDALLRTHDIVPLAAVAERRPIRSRPRAALTFDDAYRGAVTIGLREVTARGLPATVFVAPAFVGGRSLWWDALTDANSGVMGDAQRDEALDRLAGDDAAVRAWAPRAGLRERTVPDYARVSEVTELSVCATLPGITLGSHSWSHPNLTRVDPSRLREEVTRPLCWLRERFGSAVIPWLAYPYGISSPVVQAAVAAAGYRAALGIKGGWLAGDITPAYALPRFNIPASMTLDGFVLRTSGVIRW